MSQLIAFLLAAAAVSAHACIQNSIHEQLQYRCLTMLMQNVLNDCLPIHDKIPVDHC
jgi:hypothetical protein